MSSEPEESPPEPSENKSEKKKAPLFLNGWCDEHEKLMSEWSDISMCYRWIHVQSEKFYHKRSLWINLPVIILSTLGGTANFGIQSLFESDTTKKYASFGIGGISLLAGLMTTVGNYLRYAQLEEAHRVASISWGKFQRRIAIELALHPNERMIAIDFLKVCRVDLDRLIEQTPSIPSRCIAHFSEHFGSIRDLKKPDICGGLEHTFIYDSSELRLKQLAVDAGLSLTDKKTALMELWSPQIEDTIRMEVERHVERVMERGKKRETGVTLRNIVVIPSEKDGRVTPPRENPFSR
jgi:hypothetical protein